MDNGHKVLVLPGAQTGVAVRAQAHPQLARPLIDWCWQVEECGAVAEGLMVPGPGDTCEDNKTRRLPMKGLSFLNPNHA